MKIIINPKATPKAYTFGRFSRRKKHYDFTILNIT